MTRPMDLVTVEIAPGADLSADPGTWSWEDITSYVDTPVNVRTGRRSEGARVTPGEASAPLVDEDGDFAPPNPLGRWFGELDVDTPLRIRATGEDDDVFDGFIDELPSEWRVYSERIVRSRPQLRASGPLHRLQRGEQPLDSALHRAISAHPAVVAYWPGEDGDDSTSAASPLDNPPMRTFGVEFGAAPSQGDTDLPGASSVMRITDPARNVLGSVPSHTPGEVYVVQLAWMMPEEATSQRAVMDVYTTSPDLARWQARVSASNFQLRAWDADDSLVFDETESVNPDLWGTWVRAQLRLQRIFPDVVWSASLVTADPAATELNSLSDTETSADIGRIVRAGVNGPSMFQERFAGHISVFTGSVLDEPDWDLHVPFHGHTGELAADRFERLCDEEGVAHEVIAPTGGLGVDGSGDAASAPDSASLDITGDLEAAALVTLDDWASGDEQGLIGKWESSGNQRSWFLQVRSDGLLQFEWSPSGGTSGQDSVDSTAAPLVPDGGRLAVLVTVDADNGSGDADITFWTGPSLDGPWTQLGDVRNPGGTVSIHAGTAPLEVGVYDGGFGSVAMTGQVHAAYLRDGIGGSLVASPDFEAQELGTTEFDDDQGNTWTVHGDAEIVRADDSTPMGAQTPATLSTLLDEVTDADQGILSEAGFGLAYRTRASLYNQNTAAELDLSGQLAGTLRPMWDTQRRRNDVTVSRPSGSSHRMDLSGDGARYEDTLTANVESDDQLRNLAAWLIHLGVRDEYRWPLLPIRVLPSNPSLLSDMLALTPGDRVAADHPLPQLPGVDIAVLVEGVQHTIDSIVWDVGLVATPAGPYDVAVFDTSRFDAADSTLDESIDDDDTSFDVASTGRPWINSVDHSGEFPFDIQVGGERMTVSAISGGSSPQEFTVTRGVNDVTKAHDSGAPVRLSPRPAFAL